MKLNNTSKKSPWERLADIEYEQTDGIQYIGHKPKKYSGIPLNIEILKTSNGEIIIVPEGEGLLTYDRSNEEFIRRSYPDQYHCSHLNTANIDKDNDVIYIFCHNRYKGRKNRGNFEMYFIMIIDLINEKTEVISLGNLNQQYYHIGYTAASCFIHNQFHILTKSYI